MVKRLLNALASLRLTVVFLGFALVLVFAGTIAQVHVGLYRAQADYFRSFVVYWTPPGTSWKIPVYPGGWLIGSALLANLVAAFVTRFQFRVRKAGILLAHAGVIALLAGQFLTERYQLESQMRVEVGGTCNFTEDSRKNELAITDVTDPNSDSVVAIPESLLARGGDIQAPGLPFVVGVKNYFADARPAGPMSGEGEKIQATRGIGQKLLFTAAPDAQKSDDESRPAALVEIVTPQGSLGDWTVSTWLTKYPWFDVLQEDVGDLLGAPVRAPQEFSAAGRRYQIALQPKRYYKSYSITLLEFRHDVYPGTDIPRNFSSKIHLHDPVAHEDRDVVIYMNNPLRYRGETFYQASYEEGDRGSIFQVVRNPASAAPYLACSMIAAGLAVQFLTHLFGFLKKRAAVARTAAPAAPLAAEGRLA